MTIHATDLAGNTTATNFNFTLDYSSNTNPPVLNIVWPPNGTLISGTNFTVHAQVDDALDSVTATIADSSGDTNVVTVPVQRNGNAWAGNLPLAAGTNILTVTAINPAGQSTTTNLTLVQSAVMVKMDPLSSDQYNQPSVNVTGTISNTNDSLTVNGVEATITNGTWSATGIPISAVGMAVFDLEVYAGDPVNVGSEQVELLQPPTVSISTYYDYYYDWIYSVGCPYEIDSGNTFWVNGVGGSQQNTGIVCGSPYSNLEQLGPDYYLGATWDIYAFSGTYSGSDNAQFQSEIQGTSVRLDTGGEGQPGIKQLYLLLADAADYAYSDGSPLPPSSLAIRGQTLQDSGIADDSGGDWGVTVLQLQAGTTNEDVTPTSTDPNYDFNVLASMPSLTVVSNSAVQINGTTNWATVKVPSGHVYVQLNVAGGGDAAYDYVTNHISWSGGDSVPGNPLQRMVPTDVSTNTVVTATIGSTSTSLQVWVVWSTVSVQTSGTNTSPLDFPYYAGDNTLGPTNLLANPTPYLGCKVEIIGTITPIGVHQVITNGWIFYQTLTDAQFLNETNYPYPDETDVPDTVFNDPDYAYEEKTPDTNENIFALDGPGYRDNFTEWKFTANFQTAVLWNGQMASTNAQWWVSQKAESNGVYNVINNTGGLGTTTIEHTY